jgi:ribonuclease D
VLLRYELARAHDLPARVVMPDSAVIEFSKRKPVDRAGVMNVSGMPRRLLNEHADDVAAAIEAAKGATPEGERAHPLADDPRVRAESDQLWNALQARCASVGLASNLVTTRGSFSRWYLSVAEARRAGRAVGCTGGEAALFQESDWRQEAVGRWLEGFVAGSERLELEWSDSGMVAPGMRRPPGLASPG